MKPKIIQRTHIKEEVKTLPTVKEKSIPVMPQDIGEEDHNPQKIESKKEQYQEEDKMIPIFKQPVKTKMNSNQHLEEVTYSNKF